MDGVVPLRSWVDWCRYIAGKGISIEQETGNIVCGMNQLLPSLLSTNYKKTSQILQEMDQSIQTSSTSTRENSDATSRYSQVNTPDPTGSSGHDSGSKGEGKQGEDETEELAELIKAILQTVWTNSSPAMRERSQVFKAYRPDKDDEGPDDPWRWRFDDEYDDNSRFDRDLLGDNVSLKGFGLPEPHQIEKLVKIMLAEGETTREAGLGNHQMMFAECPMRLNKCSVTRHPKSVETMVWFDYALQ
jgi:hypothetical protein